VLWERVRGQIRSARTTEEHDRAVEFYGGAELTVGGLRKNAHGAEKKCC
jgi:hypothetical protein